MLEVTEGVYIRIEGPRPAVLGLLSAMASGDLPFTMRGAGGASGPGDDPSRHYYSGVWSVEDAPAIREWLALEHSSSEGS